MDIIKRLDPQQAQKIAAGEVIERPSHLVKELIENSLDAGATFIHIIAHDAGKKSITLIDNGKGMSSGDARLCIERHTTSKISKVDELESITTFGFRGEALASICAVAKVTLTTQQPQSVEGVTLYIENGIIQKETSVGSQPGTHITIEELFYNIPARKKFLKTSTVEWNHTLSLVRAYALSNPLIHFMVEHNDISILNCPPVKSCFKRAQQLFDTHFSCNTITLESTEKKEITLSGIITNHHYMRYDRSSIFIFVNNRWVKNYGLTSAFIKGYLNVLPSGKYPAGILMIQLPPHLVDINVHPKKEEVAFIHPKIIESVITQTVTQTLENHLSSQLQKNNSLSLNNLPSPETDTYETTKTTIITPHAPNTRKDYLPSFDMLNEKIFSSLEKEKFSLQPEYSSHTSLKNSALDFHQNKNATTNVSAAPEETNTLKLPEPYTIIGQYKKTYLLLEHENGLFFIDQHAAHERILYEKLHNRFEECISSPLLFPTIMTISSEDIDLLQNYSALFNEYGIVFERIGQHELAIKELPLILKNQSLDDLLKTTIVIHKEESTIDQPLLHKKINEHVRAQMACKAAIKAGDSMSHEAITSLLIDLEKTKNRFSCPHGRPTGWLLTIHEIEKKFKRIQ